MTESSDAPSPQTPTSQPASALNPKKTLIARVKDLGITVLVFAALAAGAVLSYVVTGSVPPGCHEKMDHGFCISRR